MAFTPTALTGVTTPERKVGVPYSVGYDYSQTADPNTVGANVTLFVEGNNSDLFVEEMLGYSEVVGGNLSRVLPEPCGYYRPGLGTGAEGKRMYCVGLASVSHTPTPPVAGVAVVNSEGWLEYDLEAWKATFAVPQYNVLEDEEVQYEHERFCVWRMKVTASNEKIPGGGFQYITANKEKVSEVGVKTGRQLELSCKWLDVPFYNYALLKTLCNKINDSAVTWNGVTFDTETVLLVGDDAEPRVNATGRQSYDITFSFSVKTDGRTWNKFWQSGAAGYVEVSSDGTGGGDKPFETASLQQLWLLS